MFTFFHCYYPKTWEAQKKIGIIDENSGVKFQECIQIDEDLKFNVLAKKDGELYNIIKENMHPMYIDRLQGGVFIEKYQYDFELVEEYKKLLGDKFLGFQMHEWLSNYSQDVRRIIRGNVESWTEEGIKKAIFGLFPFKHLFLESMDAKEMEEYGNPQTLDELLENGRKLLSDRYDYTSGKLIPCDSYFIATHMELKRSVTHFMPEIGAQTPNTRIQIAYARGMAKSYNISFGTYYEPWGGEPLTACCYKRDNINEWGIGSDSDFPFHTCGDNGGSSRSLQNRLFLYSYFAGAEYMGEEWGMCNVFYDWEDFELTPYGKVKLDFINFTRKYPNIGKPITPIAVVLPEELDVFDIKLPQDGTFLNQKVLDEKLAKKIINMNKNLEELFCSSGEMLGMEHNVKDYKYPDAIDIIHEDKVNENDYAYFIDLTGDDKFSKTHKNIIKPEDVIDVLDDLLPCRVDGNLHHIVNKSDDCYYLMIFNNSGVLRTLKNGEQFIKEATKTAKVTLKNPQNSLIKLEGDADISNNNNTFSISIPAGGWFFGKIL